MLIERSTKLATGAFVLGAAAAAWAMPPSVYLPLFALAAASKGLPWMADLVRNCLNSVQRDNPEDDSMPPFERDNESKAQGSPSSGNSSSLSIASDSTASDVEKKRDINSEKFAKFGPIYADMLTELSELDLTHRQKDQAMCTIKGLSKLESNLHQVRTDLQNGKTLEKSVLDVSGKKCHSENYCTVEPAIEGKPPTRIVSFDMFSNSALTTAEILKRTYLEDRKNGQLLRFFSSAFGTGCLEESSEKIVKYAERISTPVGLLTLEAKLCQHMEGSKKGAPLKLETFLAFLNQRGIPLEQFDINPAAPRENPHIKQLEKYNLIEKDFTSVFDMINEELSIWYMENTSPKLSDFQRHVGKELKIPRNEIGRIFEGYFIENPDKRDLFK